jgi:hypothetical protein
MNGRILLLLLLGASFLFFGCAKKGESAPEAPGTQLGPAGETSPPKTQDNATAPAKDNLTEDEKSVADLFQIDTDKPMGDEGLGTDTPKSKE